MTPEKQNTAEEAAIYWQEMCTLYADERNELRGQLVEAQMAIRALVKEAGNLHNSGAFFCPVCAAMDLPGVKQAFEAD